MRSSFLSSFIEFPSEVSEEKSKMSQPIRGQGGHLVFPIGPKNTKLVEDVEIFLPVKFHWILFSGFWGEIENVSANQMPGRPSCFYNRPEKHNLGRGHWDLASWQVSLNSVQPFQNRSRKCLNQSEARAAILFLRSARKIQNWYRTLRSCSLSIFVEFRSAVSEEKSKMSQPIRGQGGHVTLQFVIITQFVINYKLRWIATQFVIHRISNCVVMTTRFVMYYKLRQNFIILKYWKWEKKIDQRQNASLQSYLTMNSVRHQSFRARHAKVPINTTIVQNALLPPHFCENPFVRPSIGLFVRPSVCRKNFNIRGLSQKFVDNRHLTFVNVNYELKPISWYTWINVRGLSRKWL